MKTSVMIAGASAAALVAGQALPQNFPACGVTCITNMLGLANSFGCAPDNAKCLCSQVNFVYGVRDCADQACSGGAGGSDAQTVKQYGVNYCYQAGVAIQGLGVDASSTGSATTTIMATNSPGPNTSGRPSNSVTGSNTPVVTSIVSTLTDSAGSATGTTTIASTLNAGGASGASSTPISTVPVLTTMTSGGSTMVSTVGSSTIYGAAGGAASSTGGSAGASSTPISTVPVVSTMVSGSSTMVTTIGSSTIYGGGAAGAGSSTPISTVPVVSTMTSNGSTMTTTVGSSTIFGSGAVVSQSQTVITSGGSTLTTSVPVTQSPSGSNTAAGGSSTSRAFAAQQTAAPMGFIAAAGLAALLL